MYISDLPAFTVSSAQQLLRVVESLMGSPDFVFRGQSAAYEKTGRLTLTTTLERHSPTEEDWNRFSTWASMPDENCNSDAFKYGPLSKYERDNLLEYQSRVCHFLHDVPSENDYSSWFALMQHHGAPTRLLDVSESIFVALYFATSHQNQHDGIVYAFLTPNIRLFGEYQKHYSSVLKECDSLYWEHQAQEIATRIIAVDCGLEYPGSDSSPGWTCSPGVITFKNRRPSKRELAQQGLFLMPMTIATSFEQNLFSMYNAGYSIGELNNGQKPTWHIDNDNLDEFQLLGSFDCPIVKFRIPRASFRQIRMALRHMNITDESLFPDFDGLTRSMHGRIDWWKEVHGTM